MSRRCVTAIGRRCRKRDIAASREEARRLLHHAREKLEARDRDRVAGHVETAIKEIDIALKVK